MNENENHHFYTQDEHAKQAPSSLMPMLLARLGLDGTGRAPVTSLAALRTALASPEWTMRIAAVQELERLSDQESFQLLLMALRDEDGSVRACAVRVLGVRGNPSRHIALKQLETALHDTEWHVRETAVYALAALGDQSSLLALRETLHDTDDAVHRAALQTIQRLQHKADSDKQVENRPDTEPVPLSSHTVFGALSQHISCFALHLRPHASLTTTEKELDMLEETNEVTTEMEFGAKKLVPPRPTRPQHPLIRALEQGLAAVLILAILAGWFALNHFSHSSTGSPTAFSDAGAHPLGAPIATVHGNLSGTEGWSSDGHTFASLQINTQKHKIEASLVDAASGRSSIYPVLDSSWIPSLEAFNPFQILMKRYVLAFRAQGNNHATMEIWDLIRQRAITTQTIPAQIGKGGQVLSPEISSSDNEQKFATHSAAPDGTLTIWDVASGQKITCEGKFLSGQSVDIKWYNHDQDLLLSNYSIPHENSHLEAWNAITGTRLFNLRGSGKTYYSKAIVSPNNKYLALPTGSLQPYSLPPGAGVTSSQLHVDTLEILDAYSGKVLRSDHMHSGLDGTDASFLWLPDSQRLLMTTGNRSGISSSLPSKTTLLISTWNVFTNQATPVTSFSSSSPIGIDWSTSDGQYMILGTPDARSMKILQTSNGHQVATLETPGIYTRTTSFSALGNQYMVIGEKGDFYIWSIVTGKLLYAYHGTTPSSVYGQRGSSVIWSPNEKYLAMTAGNTNPIGEGSFAIWRMP